MASFTTSPSGAGGLVLPADYYPTMNAVVVGKRGRQAKTYHGNKRLNQIVMTKLSTYAACKTKKEKSKIIDQIIAQINSDSVNGVGFVRQDMISGRWFVCESHGARVAVAQTFRDQDVMTERYKSSKVRKQINRRQEKHQKKHQKKQVQKPSTTTTTTAKDSLPLASESLKRTSVEPTMTNVPSLASIVSDTFSSNSGVGYESNNSNSSSCHLDRGLLQSTISSALQIVEEDKDDFSSFFRTSSTRSNSMPDTYYYIGSLCSNSPPVPSGKPVRSRLLDSTSNNIIPRQEDPFEPIPLHQANNKAVTWSEESLGLQVDHLNGNNICDDPLDAMAACVVMNNEAAWAA